MKLFVYADNAATTKLDKDAFEAMKPFLLDYFGNASQPYSFSMRVRRALKEARIAIASCIDALPEEIFFTSGGSESHVREKSMKERQRFICRLLLTDV